MGQPIIASYLGSSLGGSGMKKLLVIVWMLCTSTVFAQTFPVQNLQVNGSSNFVGASNFATIPTSPTAVLGDNSGNVATTAFIRNNYVPLSSLGGLAPLASPSFTGSPTVPVAPFGSNSNQIASTFFVARHEPCVLLADYGGDPTGANDSTGALSTAISASTTGRACVKIGPGKWKFNSLFAYSLPLAQSSITIIGSGQDVTELTWPNTGGGMRFTTQGPYNSVHIRDMTLSTGQPNGGVAVNITCTGCNIPNPANSVMSDITGVTARGADGYEVADYWTTGFNVNIQPNVNFNSVMVVGPATVAGTGISTNGAGSTVAAPYNISLSSFNALSVGINYGTLTQGVTVNQCNFTGTAFGILAVPGLTGLDQLSVTNSQFNSQNAGILIQTPMNGVGISNNFFLVPNTASAITLQNVAQFTIVGNTINPAADASPNVTGFAIGAWAAAGGIITGNQFYNLTYGVTFATGAKNVNMQSNQFVGVANNILNSSNCASGCNIGGGTP